MTQVRAYSKHDDHEMREQNLLLPEFIVEDFSQPLGKVVKSLADLIWNACGYKESPNIDAEGNLVNNGGRVYLG